MDPEVIGGQPPTGFQLDLRTRGFDLTPALRQYATEHVAGKLAKHPRQIQAVIIRLEDTNGSKGGVDKCCRVEVLLPGENPVVVEEISDDLRSAMDLAADRIDKVVTRHLTQKRDLPRQRGHKLARSRKVAGP